MYTVSKIEIRTWSYGADVTGQCGIRGGEYGYQYVDRYLKKNLQAIAEKLGICQTFKICQNCDPNIKQSVNCNIIKKLQNHADD